MPLRKPTDADHIADGVRAKLLVPFLRSERRRMFRRLPTCAIPGYAPICLDTKDPETVACGFKQRLLRVLPKADPVLMARFHDFCVHEASKLPSTVPMDFDTWLESTSYNQARKDELIAANAMNMGGCPPRKICERIAAFVKTEFYCALKHARLICSRCDRFKVFCGPAAKTIENIVYDMPEFIKHTPVSERAAKVSELRAAGRRYYITDFTAFESHFEPEVMRVCECAFYLHILRFWNYVDYMCSILVGLNRIRTSVGVLAQMVGKRMSGEMFTSVGNGLTNLMLAKFCAHEQGKTLHGFVEGDDGLFATDAVLTPEFYARLGFTIKIVEIEDPCTAYPVTKGVEPGSMAFCGIIFPESGELIKDYRKFFQGFAWTSSFISAGPKIMMQLLRSKALSSVYETPQCPIIGALARYALAYTRGTVVSEAVKSSLRDSYHSTLDKLPRDESWIPKFNPNILTRELYARTYGVSIETQLTVEHHISRGEFDKVSEYLPAPFASEWFSTRYVVVT